MPGSINPLTADSPCGISLCEPATGGIPQGRRRRTQTSLSLARSPSTELRVAREHRDTEENFLVNMSRSPKALAPRGIPINRNQCGALDSKNMQAHSCPQALLTRLFGDLFIKPPNFVRLVETAEGYELTGSYSTCNVGLSMEHHSADSQKTESEVRRQQVKSSTSQIVKWL
jgi:hypothetical protein